MRHQPNVLAVFVTLTLLAGVSAAALADEVHLKNGRTMLAERTEVIGDRLVIYQLGNRIEIPMAMVLRVVEAAPPPTAEEAEAESGAPPVAEEPVQEAEGAEAAGGEEPAATEDEATAEETPPEQTEAYWQERVRTIVDEKEALDATIEELRREERAFLFSHRSTADTRKKIEAAQARQQELDQALADLRREARRLNVPPGWLRVR